MPNLDARISPFAVFTGAFLHAAHSCQKSTTRLELVLELACEMAEELDAV